MFAEIDKNYLNKTVCLQVARFDGGAYYTANFNYDNTLYSIIPQNSKINGTMQQYNQSLILSIVHYVTLGKPNTKTVVKVYKNNSQNYTK